MQPGDPAGIRVIAEFEGGSKVDMSESTQTTYRSDNPNVAIISHGGLVTAKSPGTARIIINGKITVPVSVRER